VSELDNRWGSVIVSCCFEKLVTEAGSSSGTFAIVSRYQATAAEDCNGLRRPTMSYSDL
jgi:hypothetical protein